MRLLAVDVGGTSTRAVVVEEDGTCAGYGTAGSGNPTSSGAQTAVASIIMAANRATEQSGSVRAELAAATVGIAGAGGATGPRLHEDLVREGVAKRITLEPDLLAAFSSGTIASEGYALVAGTGSAAVRVRGGRIETTCDGLGWLLGDAGSGFWLGHRAVLAASSALDDRGPPTALVRLVLAQMGISLTGSRDSGGRLSALQQMVGAVYQLRPVQLAEFAPLVFEAETAGDDIAREIIAEAAKALSATLDAVVKPDLAGPLVLSGSVLSKQQTVTEQVVTTFRRGADDAPVITVSDGVVGAVVLALRGSGLTVDDATFDRVRSTLAALR